MSSVSAVSPYDKFCNELNDKHRIRDFVAVNFVSSDGKTIYYFDFARPTSDERTLIGSAELSRRYSDVSRKTVETVYHFPITLQAIVRRLISQQYRIMIL